MKCGSVKLTGNYDSSWISPMGYNYYTQNDVKMVFWIQSITSYGTSYRVNFIPLFSTYPTDLAGSSGYFSISQLLVENVDGIYKPVEQSIDDRWNGYYNETYDIYYRTNESMYFPSGYDYGVSADLDVLDYTWEGSYDDLCRAAREYFDSLAAPPIYVGVNGKARQVKKMYVGVNGKAREVKAIYVGVNGKARKVF